MDLPWFRKRLPTDPVRKRHRVYRHSSPCPKCGDFLWHSPTDYDGVGWNSDFCRRCDAWIDAHYDTTECSRRPERPSLVPYRDQVSVGTYLDQRHGLPVWPLPGHEGVAGAALVGLPIGQSDLTLVGMEMRLGRPDKADDFAASRLVLHPRGTDLEVARVAVHRNHPPAPAPLSEPDLQRLRLSADCTYAVRAFDVPDRTCLLRYIGLAVCLVDPTGGQDNAWLIGDTDIVTTASA